MGQKIDKLIKSITFGFGGHHDAEQSGVAHPEGEIAAIAAAVYAVLGGSARIVSITPAGGGAWTAGGRLLHQSSHAVHRRSPTR